MKNKKVLYGVMGFAAGLFLAFAFLVPRTFAEYGAGLNLSSIQPPVPKDYGRLVAVSGIFYYFQAEDGKVYVLKLRTDTQWDNRVSVIERGA